MPVHKENPSKIEDAKKSLKLCFISDGKIGHLRQLKGLALGLSELAHVHEDWLQVKKIKTIRSLPMGQYDIVIGAGHKTHLPTFFTSRSKGAMSTLLMKPTLPQTMFDAIIAPEHDKLRPSDRTFSTVGPLNDFQFEEQLQPTHNLILLGGPSKHFDWDEQTIISQITALIKQRAGEPWVALSSRRTPSTLLNKLPNEIIVDSTSMTIETALKQAEIVCITPDSHNMVFEALSLGKTPILLRLKPKLRLFGKSRVALSLQKLHQEKRICLLGEETSTDIALAPILNEKRRAAAWLINRYHHWLQE